LLPPRVSTQPEARIRVVAVEDDARYRASLEVLLRHSPEFVLVGSFGSPAAALSALERGDGAGGDAAWDLVLMDLDLPGMTGVECTRRVKAALPGAAVVVLTVFEERATILEAICAGADGYLLKRTPADQLLLQLRAVLAGGSPLSAGVAKSVLDIVRQINDGGQWRASHDGSRVDLTPREAEVLRCLVNGMSYKGTSAALDVSIDTVRSHIRTVYRKLQVHSVAEAVGRALREKLV
jgi:DNA-binding NarL/FixJ family response regulator